MATRELRTQIDSGAVPSSAFTDVQLKAIRKAVKNRGQTTLYINSGLTPIFLHQDTGRMQLVPEVLHNGARHVGWESMSKGQ
ncbi:HNH endonuclease [Pseudomonas sp. B22129]|uniref:HNH endonuclease n=1 Tax=Pseudomonas sp. B22129 TaxID=3235111 RepID=UPI003784B5C6